MTLTQVLLEEASTSFAVAERLFRRVADDELGWKPAEGREWMTVGQLLMHTASFGCGKAARGFVTGEWPAGAQSDDATAHVAAPDALPSVSSVRHALALLAEDREVALTAICAAGEEHLLAQSVAAPWGGPALPLFQQLLQMVQHLTQHKGQLFYYLKLMGKQVDSRDLWGV